MEDKAYAKSVHRLGRIGTVVTLLLLVGAPFVVWSIYGFPKASDVIQPMVTILVALSPSLLAEVFAYTPILGTSAYMAFITGNVINLKLPAAMSAQSIIKAEPNTPKADVISTMAIALSSIETVVIVALGVLLLRPLQPVLQAPVFQTASGYIIPALLGGMMLGTMVKSGGKTKMQGKWLISLLPVLVTILCLKLIPTFSSIQGYAIIVLIFVTIGWAYLLYKKNIVKLVALGHSNAYLCCSHTHPLVHLNEDLRIEHLAAYEMYHFLQLGDLSPIPPLPIVYQEAPLLRIMDRRRYNPNLVIWGAQPYTDTYTLYNNCVIPLPKSFWGYTYGCIYKQGYRPNNFVLEIIQEIAKEINEASNAIG